jgi:hypothetical protein
MGARFRVEYDEYDPLDPMWASYSTCHQYTAGDTLIDSTRVIKIALSPLFTCYSSGGAGPSMPALAAGYLMVDSLSGKTWYKQVGQAPQLLYDFSASVGDTLPYPSLLDVHSYSPVLVIDSIDTVTFSDGIPRIRQWITASGLFAGHMPVYVEGIGDLYHGFLPLASFEDSYYSTCYQEFGLDLYSDIGIASCPSALDCDLLTGSASLAERGSMVIAPNPSQTLAIEGLPTSAEVELVGMDGKTFAIGRSCDITSGLPQGIYWVRAMDAGKVIFQGKWVKVD